MAKDTVILERRFVPAGTVIMKEGEEANCAYLIQSGSVEVYSDLGGKEVVLAELGIGEICGEMALASDEPRTANVRVKEDCNLIVIARQTFLEKMKSSDPTIRAVVEMLINRLIKGNTTITTHQRGDVTSLIDLTNTLLENFAHSLSDQDKKLFKESVRPTFNELVEKLEKFSR